MEWVDDEYLTDLGRLWAEALLTADLTPQERAWWEERLDDWADGMPGGSALEIAVAAAAQGWDYPPLVAVFQGHITQKGAWEDEVPDFADDLAEIRLRILERQGRFEEYLNLAEAEGQFMLYLQMLIRLGRNEQAFADARDGLAAPGEVLTIARALAEHGDVERALELAAHGLAMEATSGRAVLAEWRGTRPGPTAGPTWPSRPPGRPCGTTPLWRTIAGSGSTWGRVAGPSRRGSSDSGIQQELPGRRRHLPFGGDVSGGDDPRRPAPLAGERGPGHRGREGPVSRVGL